MKASLHQVPSWLRPPMIAALVAAAIVLAACATPSTFPNGNNATCWTKTNSTQKDTPTCEQQTEKWTDFGDVWLWTQCDSSGLTIYEMKYDAGKCATYPTTLLNEGHGDTYAQIFFGQDEAGYPSLFVDCAGAAENNSHALTVKWDFAGDPTPPATNTLRASTGLCAVPVEVYALTTGEYAVNIGPDGEGKVASTVFSGPPVANLHFADSNVNATPAN
jgi:hypothetical protein